MNSTSLIPGQTNRGEMLANGSIPTGYLAGPQPFAAPAGTANQPPVDIWGAVLRRKFVVILLALVGAGLGYLHFIKTPDKFRSHVQISVLTTMPPSSLVGADLVHQKVSMAVHKTLITSELVIEKAIRNGGLEKTELLREAKSPVGAIKKALSVQSVNKADEVWELTLVGPDAEELPKILRSIVSAYTEVVTEDNRAFGEEAVSLVEKLQQQLIEDESKAKLRYLELVRGLGTEGLGDDGQMINPFAPQVKSLMDEQSQARRELQDVVEKLSTAVQVVESPDDTHLKVLALDARRYLGFASDQKRGTGESRRIENAVADVRMLEKQIEQLQNKIVEIGFERRELATLLGSGNPKIKALDDKAKHYQAELNKTIQQRDNLTSAVETMDEEAIKGLVDWSSLEEKTELEIIKLYLAYLEQQKNNLIANLDRIGKDLDFTQAEASKVSGDVAEIRLLQTEIQDKRDYIRVIMGRLSEMDLLSQNHSNTRVKTHDNPGIGYKIEPVIFKSMGIGVFLASLLGVGLALLIDRADLSFHNPLEIFQRVDVPVVGRIPRLKLLERKSPNEKIVGTPTLVCINQPNSSGSEAFRSIRTHLLFDAATHGTKLVMITSPSPGDGKSTVSCNLAISLAQSGKRVALVDADLRRPRVHQHFDVEAQPGLMSVLKGEKTLKEALKPTVLPNLYLLTSGRRPKNPGEVVTSTNFVKVLEMLKDGFDFVILDTPPVIPVADPTSIATLVDGVYMVFRIRRGVKITAARAKESLAQVNARLLGVVVNGLDENPHYYDYGGYYQHSGYNYGYGKVYQDRLEKAYQDDNDEIYDDEIENYK